MEKEVAIREYALSVALEIQGEADSVERLLNNARQIEEFIKDTPQLIQRPEGK